MWLRIYNCFHFLLSFYISISSSIDIIQIIVAFIIFVNCNIFVPNSTLIYKISALSEQTTSQPSTEPQITTQPTIEQRISDPTTEVQTITPEVLIQANKPKNSFVLDESGVISIKGKYIFCFTKYHKACQSCS